MLRPHCSCTSCSHADVNIAPIDDVAANWGDTLTELLLEDKPANGAGTDAMDQVDVERRGQAGQDGNVRLLSIDAQWGVDRIHRATFKVPTAMWRARRANTSLARSRRR